MFDMHYDLLSRLYYEYITYGYIRKEVKEDIKNIFNDDNIIGSCINLYFKNPKEMFNEIGLSLNELMNVKNIFRTSIKLIEDLIKENIINKNIKFIYSIEGADYIKSPNELEELYELGLRSILIVWNNKNKYGSGNKSDIGLTKLGRELIKKAIDLGLIIDVSHANEKTFYDILNEVKEAKLKEIDVILMASHSNALEIQNVNRNLSYNQLIKLKELDGYIGVVGYNPFISNKEFKQKYLEHIDYMMNKVGFSPNKILLSTDNMNFLNNYNNTFNMHSIMREIQELLLKKYDKEIVEKILIGNATDIYNKLK